MDNLVPDQAPRTRAADADRPASSAQDPAPAPAAATRSPGTMQRLRLDTTPTPTVRCHVLVEGKVQGVYFRESTRREADRLGVRGWVRNLDDGRVEAEFEGAADRVGELVAWCRQGPAGARVDALTTSSRPTVGEQGPSGFTVRRGPEA